jgi:hypothetical protein
VKLCLHVHPDTGVTCTKKAIQGGLCNTHGAETKKCRFVDPRTKETCSKMSKQDGLCIGHGAQVQLCRHVDPDTKEACVRYAKQGGLCIGHGAKLKLCCHADPLTKEACTRYAVKGGVCIGHGAPGRLCKHVDPNTNAACSKHVQVGGLCASHGGGYRCEMPCCTSTHEGTPSLATGKHPVTGAHMCTFAMRFMVSAAQTKAEKTVLLRRFGFKRDLVLRGEHAFYHKLVLLVPELALSERVLDESVLSKCAGKAKSFSDPRPDYLHYFADGDVQLALAGEYDERPGHEDDDDRLGVIADMCGCGAENMYVFRVLGRHDSDRAVCVRKIRQQNAYYKVTQEGMSVVRKTAAVVRERLEWIAQGLAPDDNAGRPRKVYVNF